MTGAQVRDDLPAVACREANHLGVWRRRVARFFASTRARPSRRLRRRAVARAREERTKDNSPSNHGGSVHSTPMTRTAAALIIGDEVLSGKVHDTNSHDLARYLRALGIELSRIITVPDRVEVIAAELNALRAKVDLVFTSGGIGPTHDDVTIDAIALALGRETVRHPALERSLREHLEERCTDDHLRMAMIVDGTELDFGPEGAAPWPVLILGSIFILPGIPQLFRAQLELLRPRVSGSERAFVVESAFCAADEGRLKPFIDAVVSAFEDVAVGSYPRFRDGDDGYNVRITFDGRDPARVREARERFVASLPAAWLLSTEP